MLLAACDTFRAAAVDQLETWADRAEVECVGPSSEDDKPATVLFRALDKGIAEDFDVVIVDTSGRLANNVQLTEELKKMRRTIEKKVGGAHWPSLLLDIRRGEARSEACACLPALCVYIYLPACCSMSV